MTVYALLRCSNKSCNSEHKVYFEPNRFCNFEYVCNKCGTTIRFRNVQGTPFQNVIPSDAIIASKMN